MTLSEAEELSLKLLALRMYTDDMAGLNCSTCTIQDKMNCSMDKNRDEQVYWNDVLRVDINTCPINCILPHHYAFWDQYLYYQEGGQMPQYGDCNLYYWSTHKAFAHHRRMIENDEIRRGKNEQR